jgi:hypothetical protein
LFLWSKNYIFHETHTHFHLSYDVLLLDLSLAVFFSVVLIGVWIFPIDFCSSQVVTHFLVRAGTDFSFQFPDRPCSVPALAKVIARSECLLFPVLFFSLSTGRARRRFQISSSLLLAAQWPSWLFFTSLVDLHPDFSIPAAASPGR